MVNVNPAPANVPPALIVRLVTGIEPASVTVCGDTMMAVSVAPGMVTTGTPTHDQVAGNAQLPDAMLVQVAASAAGVQIRAASATIIGRVMRIILGGFKVQVQQC